MTILVTGATGTVGRRVVEQLLERGEHVRALTRDPARAELPDGVDVARGDLTDPASLGPASEGAVREPFTGRLSAMVHEADIGAVAAAALTEDGHGGQEYLITGPEVLTVGDRTAAVAAARGAAVELVELTEEQALETWRGQGMPEDVIAFLIDVYRDTPPEGRTVNDTVEKVTGRPTRTFAQWAEEHADHFRAGA